MTFRKIFIPILFVAIGFNYACNEGSTSAEEIESAQSNNLIDDIQESVNNYFTIEEEGDFIRSTYTGEYSEPFVGHVYEFVITKKMEEGGEFNYLATVSYDESTRSMSIVDRDFYMFTTIEDMPGWIEKRLKLNEAKTVK